MHDSYLAYCFLVLVNPISMLEWIIETLDFSSDQEQRGFGEYK